ncbi:putative dithiol-disulfide oxidoreductase (DUF899 family) [Streptosporangium album]|uniref:Putative dithiol-disulfide oxidoreductase (DUF899 family) n=1 Tax=Streptosporangium album TaxID=47479 RepID=A0A7W7RS57_9ACTN|nr:DUF899 domain-containing protein [Streptosporangium album]MBB4937191.1 putative dithiol-disulfide oxidoreductase (DUF899 family) [Streptosporangium album]
MDLPQIVSRGEWLAARKELLAQEKEAMRAQDAVTARRRELPMVEIDKEYVFEGPEGKVSLTDLFEGRRQLIVYHFMWLHDRREGCPSCSLVTDNIGHLAHLHALDTSLVLVSRAPYDDIEPFKRRMGWTVPWYSSHGSDFNFDFHVSFDSLVKPAEYNYKDQATLEREGLTTALVRDGQDAHGLSVFLRDGDRVFHTYSTYGRGAETVVGTYHYLDLTLLGRRRYINQFLHHDKY